MSTRAERIKAFVNAMATERPGTFISVLALLVGSALAAAAVAATALLSGPIGVALQKPFFALPASRLTVLQMGASAALVAFLGFAFTVATWDGAPGWLLGMCGARWLRRVGEALRTPGRPAAPWPFWACAGAVVLWASVAMLVSLPVVAFIEPDTIGYLAPSPLRSSGYMLVLKAVAGLTGDLKWIVPVQLEAMLLSFVALGWAVKGLLRSQSAGILVVAVLSLSSGLLILAPTVMTEAFFVALICVHLAAVLTALRRLSWGPVILVGVTLAAMIVLRPNGLSFLAGVPMLVLYFRRRWRMVALATLGPVVIACLAQGAYHERTFGFFGLHRFSGILLAGAAAPLFRADMPTEYPGLARDLASRLKTYSRDFPPFEERGYPFEMAHVASLTAVGAIYLEILPAIRRKLNLPAPAQVVFENDPRIDAIAGSLAWSAIRNDPWGFFKIITSNYIANWRVTLPVRVPMSIFYPRGLELAREISRQIPARLSRYTDLSQYEDPGLQKRINAIGRAGIRVIEGPGLVIDVFQLLFACIAFGLSIWGLVALVRRWNSADVACRALVYGAVVLQAGYGLISIGNASFTRYTVVFDPVVVVILVVGAAMGLRYVFADSDPESMFP